MIQYDRKAGRYRDEKGRFVSRSTILNLIDREVSATEAKLVQTTQRLIAGQINLSQWQSAVATEIKESHIRAAILSAGGKEQMTRQLYGSLGQRLQSQYRYLNGFAQQLLQGEMSEARALWRSRLYGNSLRESFFRVEQLKKQNEGFNVAKRNLDSQAEHCSDCPSYSTNGHWLPVSLVTPPGNNCACRSRCRCSIQYAKLINGAIVPS